MSFLTDVKSSLHTFHQDIKKHVDHISDAITAEVHSHTHLDQSCRKLHLTHRDNRFHSFAPQRTGNEAKWFVDGCGYMWAVSVAIEEATESIWILDWWLSPELYLRRPPSENENYRLDRMLLAAANKGVKVNIIVYKEVAAVLTLCSEHTKKALEVHPNIAVFRHPDHIPSGQVLQSSMSSYLKKFSLKSLQLADVPGDAFKALYGMNEDVILYWAHHEKLCLIDGKQAFMGGLDLCFGRWDTNDHPIADAHPTNLEKILFPGQDFNNARVFDFQDVTHWDQNKLDRTESSRMGWSDLSMCLQGQVVDDLKAHFVQRWNFVYFEKYDVQKDIRYQPLVLQTSLIPEGYYHENGTNIKSIRRIVGGDGDDSDDPDKSVPANDEGHHFNLQHGSGLYGNFKSRLKQNFANLGGADNDREAAPTGMSVQLLRSCTRWSNGNSTEHSIATAYIDTIRDSKHFVYIENQFFITATDDAQHPVRNKIGAAIAERIVRAFQNNEKYKVIVCMPAVPAFAGDLHADDSLGTRAIMEYQYNSICRGGHSIMEAVEKAGVPDAKKYIRFYNLRNYDRINAGAGTAMEAAEQASGVNYESARKEHDDIVGAGFDGRGEGTGAAAGQHNDQYDRYQQAGAQISDWSQYDSISEAYMDSGPALTDIPWAGSPEAELDAFVSEELYIHSKILIADDRIVICGSANLNDRSQLGFHDSEIAVLIEDPTPVSSHMDGKPYIASAYAASLRRQLFRKHLGLLNYQDPTKPTSNFLPLGKAPNDYDWGSPADTLVRDVMTHEFDNLWNITARVNTEVFNKAFHVVPADNCLDWGDYQKWFQELFVSKSKPDAKEQIPAKYEYGHVVKEEFPGGVAELKEWLGRVRGTLVDMPLDFMKNVDFAVSGLKLNALTDEVYT